MRRLVIARTEIESLKRDVLDVVWKTGWRSPTQQIMLALIYTALNAITQMEILLPTISFVNPKINPTVDTTKEMIAAINNEIRDESVT